MATSYRFSARGNQIYVTHDGNTKTVDTGTLLTQDQLEERFFSDIIKDANDTKTTVASIQEKLNDYFPTKRARILPTVESQSRLKQLREMILERPDIRNNTRVYPNRNRTSNAGSEMKVLDQKYVLPESGKGYKTVCKNPNVISVRTAAAILDSADKPQYTSIFNENILFDETFTNRLGFGNNITWETQKMNEENAKVSINFGTRNTEEGIVDIKNKKRGALGKYVVGNEVKNGLINKEEREVPREDKIKYLIMKELGDVAQIWMYLAFNVYKLIKDPTFNTTESAMITTDSVVFTVCSMLHLSCLYTGSREGVISGHCTLIHYSAGDIDYRLSFENDILNTKNHIEQHNESIKLFLNRLISPEQTTDEKKKIATYYHVLKRGKLDKEYINAYVYYPEINTLIETTIRDIEDRTTGLKDKYEEFKMLSSNVTNNQQQKELHDRFIEEANKFKCEKFVTKVVKRDELDDKKIISSYYFLHPGDFLTKLIPLMSSIRREREVSYPKNLQEILKHLEKSRESTVETLLGGKKKNKQHGGQLIGKYGSDYYECLMLCYIYMFFRVFNYTINQSSLNIFDDDQVVFDDGTRNVFALFYDSLAYDLNYYGQLVGLDRCLLRGDCVEERPGGADVPSDIVSFEDIFALGTDEEILELGGKLSNYVYLAKDYGEPLDDDEDMTTSLTTESYEGVEETKQGETTPAAQPQPFVFQFAPPVSQSAPPPPPVFQFAPSVAPPFTSTRENPKRKREEETAQSNISNILNTTFTLQGIGQSKRRRPFSVDRQQQYPPAIPVGPVGGKRRKRTIKKKLSHKTIKHKQRKLKQKKTRKQKNQRKHRFKKSRKYRN